VEPPSESPEAPVADVPSSVPPPAGVQLVSSAPPPPAAFVEAWAIRAAAEAAGLRLPPSVYANVSAALTAGKHLVLTGAPGAGKTTLALAVARAAAQSGHAHGATVVTAEPSRELLVEAAGRGRWVIVDELDQADADAALGPLSTFLSGVPVTLTQDKEAAPADGWRIVATYNGGSPTAAILRRFAVIDVAAPSADELRALLHQAANGDPTASRAAGRLLQLAELAPIGAGVFLDAARHAAARNAAVPTDEATLAREAYAAYVAPVHPDLDERRVDKLLKGS
jgi:MoxR-like ATPase